MSKSASWDKGLREKAKAEGLGLLSVCTDTNAGKMDFWGAAPHDLVRKVWRFAHLVYKGYHTGETTPRQAFDAVWPEETKDKPK